MSTPTEQAISWTCQSTWRKASVNTLWCLLGCSIGDFGTIFFFQISFFKLRLFQFVIFLTSTFIQIFILCFYLNEFDNFNSNIKRNRNKNLKKNNHRKKNKKSVYKSSSSAHRPTPFIHSCLAGTTAYNVGQFWIQNL